MASATKPCNCLTNQEKMSSGRHGPASQGILFTWTFLLACDYLVIVTEFQAGGGTQLLLFKSIVSMYTLYIMQMFPRRPENQSLNKTAELTGCLENT